LGESLYARRMMVVFVGTPLALLLHRLLAWRLGMPVLHTLCGDLLVMGSVLAVAGLVLERWLLWLAAAMLTGFLAVMVVPEWAPVALFLAAPSSWALSVYFIRRS